MSQQFRYTQSRPGNGHNSKQKKDDGDEFMRLSDREIAGCISDIGVPFSPADLQQPQPALIQRVFEWFAELLTNTTRETVEPAMREAARDVCGAENAESLVPVDTRNLMGFFASLRKLLIECGIADLAFSDLTRPTHPRLVKIFSYIINFVRFRESQAVAIDAHFNKAEAVKARIEELYARNSELSERLAHQREARKKADTQSRDKKARNEQLMKSLIGLRRGQEQLAVNMEHVKADKAALARTLEDRAERAVATQQECAKLRPYASQVQAEAGNSNTTTTIAGVTSAAAAANVASSSVQGGGGGLQSRLTELAESLARDRARAESLERRARALQTSADSFDLVVRRDVEPCTQLLSDAAADLAREDDESREAARRKDAVAQRSGEARDLEHEEQALDSQLRSWEKRSETLRRQAKERERLVTERTRAIREEHASIAKERAENNREVERKRVRVEQTEKKMADLKENIENEIHAAQAEYLKMEAHIKLYIAEMEQAL